MRRWQLGLVWLGLFTAAVITCFTAAAVLRGPTTDAETVAEFCRRLEEKHWAFSKDEYIAGIRFIRYEREWMDLRLSAELMIAPHEQPSLLAFAVRGPFGHKGSKTEGLALCRSAASACLPSAQDQIMQAMGAVRKRGATSEDGILRWEGSAMAPSNWRVTVLDFLVVYPGNPDNALVMLDFSREAP